MTKRWPGLIGAACWLGFGFAVQAQVVEPRLWITDDTTRMVYEVTLDGDPRSSFAVRINGNTQNPPPSEIAFDQRTDTLWVVTEDPGRLINFSITGTQLAPPIFTDSFGAIGPEGVAVAVDKFADTLWVVDDPELEQPMVFEITKDGDLLRSFETSVYDMESTSPQGIAVDPFDGTLWIVDNSEDTIYNVRRDGSLIGCLAAAGDCDDIDFGDVAGFSNPQGITVSTSDGSLWVSDRETDLIYNLSRSGGAVISTFPTSTYGDNSENATGVAYQPGILGTAETLSALAFDNSKLKLEKGALIDGDVGIAADAEADLKEGEIAGMLFIDPDAKKIKLDDTVVIGGGSVVVDLSRLVADVQEAVETAADLAPTQTFGEIKDSTVINGDRPLNVIEVDKIKLKEGTLTLIGDEQSEFVVNVANEIKLEKGSVIVLGGGLAPGRVAFDLVKKDLKVKDGSTARGIFLVPDGKVEIAKDSLLEGAIFTGKELKVSDSELVDTP